MTTAREEAERIAKTGRGEIWWDRWEGEHDLDALEKAISDTLEQRDAKIAKLQEELKMILLFPKDGWRRHTLFGKPVKEYLDEYKKQDSLIRRLVGALVNRDGGSHDSDCKKNRVHVLSCNCGHEEVDVLLSDPQVKPYRGDNG